MGGNNISVSFTNDDVTQAAPHLTGALSCVVLEHIDALLTSYIREAGCELISQVVHMTGWDINGALYRESQEKMYYDKQIS